MLGADITGKWAGLVETDAGSGSPNFTFQQTGETLTGTYSGMLGETKLTGTVKGDEVEFSFSGDAQGNTVKVVYKAKLTSAKEMKGTVSIEGLGSGTFKATKQ